MQVNQGFDRLRQYVRLPGLSKKKLSKVDTLRAAVVYIKQLLSLLAEADAMAASAASRHINEQLLSTQNYQQQQHQQQPENAAFDDVTSSSSGFFLSLLQTGINLTTESHDVTASTSGLLATASPPDGPSLSYSTGSACLPLADVNDNNYFVGELCPPEVDIVHLADATEQQRRLNELTAWLME